LGTTGDTLNEDEFDLAFKYIHNKSVNLTLSSLGVTKEGLYWIIALLSLFLLLIFTFIFMGIFACKNYQILK